MYRVLLVEDEEASRLYFRKTLLAEMPDAELMEAESIPTAERIIDDYAARGNSFESVILDCHLPSENGVFELNTSLETEFETVKLTLTGE